MDSYNNDIYTNVELAFNLSEHSAKLPELCVLTTQFESNTMSRALIISTTTAVAAQSETNDRVVSGQHDNYCQLFKKLICR